MYIYIYIKVYMYIFLRANKKNPKVSRFTVFHVMLAIFTRDMICIGWYLTVYFYFNTESIKDANILRNWNKIHCAIKLSREPTGKTIPINLSDIQLVFQTVRKNHCKENHGLEEENYYLWNYFSNRFHRWDL